MNALKRFLSRAKKRMPAGWKDTLSALGWFLVVLEIFAVFNGWTLVSTHASSGLGKYLERDIIVSLVLALPVLLPERLSKAYAIALFSAMAIFTSVNCVHTYLYGTPASSYLLTVAQETYSEELHDFVVQFFDSGAIAWILAVLLLPLPALLMSLRSSCRSPQLSLIIVVVVVSIVAGKCLQHGTELTARRNYVMDVIWSCVTACKEQAKFTAEVTQFRNMPSGIHTDAKDRLIVLVIGESSGRNHYSLY